MVEEQTDHHVDLILPFLILNCLDDLSEVIKCITDLWCFAKEHNWSLVLYAIGSIINPIRPCLSSLSSGPGWGLLGLHVKKLCELRQHPLFAPQNLALNNCRYSIIHATKFELGISSIFRDMTSESYSSHEGNESSNSCIYVPLRTKFKVDMKRKFLSSHMKVHEKQEWTLLTVFWYLIWFQRYLRLKGRNMTLKIRSLQTTTTVKIMTSSGLHVDHWVIRLTITR